MLGRQKVHTRLFYEFDLETHIPPTISFGVLTASWI